MAKSAIVALAFPSLSEASTGFPNVKELGEVQMASRFPVKKDKSGVVSLGVLVPVRVGESG